MFSKVFKYDFKYVFRYWWIGAVMALLLSLGGGGLFASLTSNASEVENFLLTMLSGFGLVAVFIGLCAFPFIALIACTVRYYKNFFSDEGYLTFTLPVSRATLLNAKTLNFFLFNIMTYLVLFIGILLLFGIGLSPVMYSGEMIPSMPTLSAQETRWLISFLILLPLYLIMATFAGINILYLSITIGSVVSQKHKVLSGIGIYLLFNTANSFIQELIQTLFLNPVLSGNLYFEEVGGVLDLVTIFILVETLVLAAIAIGTYFWNLHLIKNKLNLS